MCDEINNELAEEHAEATKMSGSRVTDIRAHRWKAGQLELEVHWDTENVSWESFQDLKLDHPNTTAQYIVANNVSCSKRLDRVMQSAKKTVRDIKRAVRRIARLYEHHFDGCDQVYTVRRGDIRNKKKHP
jgi:hypothetical protein